MTILRTDSNIRDKEPAMFDHSNVRVNFNSADYSNLIFPEKDKLILKNLGAEIAALASGPKMEERKKLWYSHNRLEKTRPVILCDPENGWNEIIADDEILCSNDIARHWENHLRKQLFWGQEMDDDYPVEPLFNLPLIYSETPWNVKNSQKEVTTQKALLDGGAYHIDTILEDYDQLKDLVKPSLTIDQQKSGQLFETASEIFTGTLEVRTNSLWFWSVGLTDEFTFLRGMNNLFMDFYDAPHKIHQLMSLLLEGTMEKLDFLEEKGLFNLNNDGTYVGSGGLGFTDELPGKGFEGIVRTQDMWGLAESQVTIGVSPEMFGEFIFPYQKQLMERFGLSCYGCCEPMDDRIDIVKSVSNLRRVSVSPWANKEIMADKLKHDYIYSLKPNPSHLAVPHINEDLIRRETKEALALTRHNCLEIIMKDNHTLGGNRENVKKWTKIVREEIENL